MNRFVADHYGRQKIGGWWQLFWRPSDRSNQHFKFCDNASDNCFAKAPKNTERHEKMTRAVENDIASAEMKKRIVAYEAKRQRSWCPCCISLPDVWDPKNTNGNSKPQENLKPKPMRR